MITANLLHKKENIKLISTVDIASINFGNQNLKELEVLSVNVNQDEVLVSFWSNENKTWMHCDWSVNEFNEKCEKYGYILLK